MSAGERKVNWASGDLYEPYVGRWSRLVARELLAWLAAPPGLDWLDVGCGTGALTEAAAERCAPRPPRGSGPLARVPGVRAAATRAGAAGWNARQLPVRSGTGAGRAAHATGRRFDAAAVIQRRSTQSTGA